LTTNSALAFYEAFPSPYHLEDVTVEQLALLLKSASKQSSTTKAAFILETIKKDKVKQAEFQEMRDFTTLSSIEK